MKTPQEIIKQLQTEWREPKFAIHTGSKTPFPLSCSFVSNDSNVIETSILIPDDLRSFWYNIESARLFVDNLYWQWGLELYNPRRSISTTKAYEDERHKDYKDGDLIIGHFLGDSDRLMIRCDPYKNDYGHVLIVLPLDPRVEWYSVGCSFQEFLMNYSFEQGAKFWERL